MRYMPLVLLGRNKWRERGRKRASNEREEILLERKLGERKDGNEKGEVREA